MNYDDKIDYAIDDTPVEAKWLRLELPFPNDSDLFTVRYGYLSYTKALLARLEFKINVDFKVDSNYHKDKMVIFLAPQAAEYASWIGLNWNPK